MFIMESCAQNRRVSDKLIEKIAVELYTLCDNRHPSCTLTQLKFTSCNAAHSQGGIPFSKASCPTEESSATFMFMDIFERGLAILLHLIKNKKIPDICTKEEKYVLCKLLDFIENDGQFPTDNLERKTETELITMMANHLFGQLATSSQYTMDRNYAGKGKKNDCLCGQPDCKLTGIFGDTSIGNPEVWHGNLNIIINDDLAVEPVEDYPDSPGDKSPVEVELKSTGLSRNEQIVAETVVFSFLQKRRHPEKAHFLTPCIGIRSSDMLITFYDSENDVLLESSRILLMKPSFEINILAVLVSWLVVNHKYLCTGLKDDMKSYKADFFSHAERKMEVYTKHLQLGNVGDSFMNKNLNFKDPPKWRPNLFEAFTETVSVLSELKRNEGN